jgi:hypothetical protein
MGKLCDVTTVSGVMRTCDFTLFEEQHMILSRLFYGVWWKNLCSHTHDLDKVFQPEITYFHLIDLKAKREFVFFTRMELVSGIKANYKI